MRQWGENIKLRREALNADGMPLQSGESCMTQAQLGELLDPPVHQTTVARWEAGAMEPRRRFKPQLARVLICDTRMLFPMARSIV